MERRRLRVLAIHKRPQRFSSLFAFPCDDPENNLASTATALVVSSSIAGLFSKGISLIRNRHLLKR